MILPHISKFEKGGQVMIKTFRKTGPWQSNWEGPYEILDTLGVMLQVQRPLNSVKNARRQQKIWVHTDQCKLFMPR